MSPLAGTHPAPELLRALRRVLRPLVRLMLGSGVTYPLVAEMLKGLFVEVSEREFRLGDTSPSDSRISLLSGVHRKDVRRLRGSIVEGGEPIPEGVSFGGRLATTWLTDRRFLDRKGRPRPLPKTRTNDEEVTFEDLVAERTTDIRPRVVLDEWLRLGVVHVDDDDRVVLNTDAFVPKTGMEEKLFFYAQNLHDHAAAATDNLLQTRAPQFERSLIYEGLSEDATATVDQRARELGMRMLQDLNRLATRLEDKDTSTPGPRSRLTCGIYFYSEPLPERSD